MKNITDHAKKIASIDYLRKNVCKTFDFSKLVDTG